MSKNNVKIFSGRFLQFYNEEQKTSTDFNRNLILCYVENTLI